MLLGAASGMVYLFENTTQIGAWRPEAWVRFANFGFGRDIEHGFVLRRWGGLYVNENRMERAPE
jgi:hypothetical protein